MQSLVACSTISAWYTQSVIIVILHYQRMVRISQLFMRFSVLPRKSCQKEQCPTMTMIFSGREDSQRASSEVRFCSVEVWNWVSELWVGDRGGRIASRSAQRQASSGVNEAALLKESCCCHDTVESTIYLVV